MNLSDESNQRSMLAGAITIGWATSVEMWLVGFLLRLPGLEAPALALGLLFLAIHVGSGVLAALLLPREGLARASLVAGAVTGAINLLVVGAVVADGGQDGSIQEGAWLAILGYPVVSALACLTGAILGSRLLNLEPLARRPHDAPAWLAIFGTVTIASAIPVLLSGGLVTSHEAGLAVPDWPGSFGANMFLFPLSKMTGGIYFEHAHRLFGSLVGLTVIALLVFTMRVDSRRVIKELAALGLVFVIVQGILGGVRVVSADEAPNPEPMAQQTMDNAQSVGLAVIHGIVAQLFFAFLCVLVATLTTTWRGIGSGSITPAHERDDPRLRRAATIALGLLVVQLGLGSVTRHMQSDHGSYTHAGFALIVLIGVLLAGARAIGHHKSEPILRKLGHSTIHATGLQVLLGLATLLLVLPYDDPEPDSTATVLVATAHHFIGAMLLGLAALLWVWSLRFKVPRSGVS